MVGAAPGEPGQDVGDEVALGVDEQDPSAGVGVGEDHVAEQGHTRQNVIISPRSRLDRESATTTHRHQRRGRPTPTGDHRIITVRDHFRR